MGLNPSEFDEITSKQAGSAQAEPNQLKANPIQLHQNQEKNTSMKLISIEINQPEFDVV